MPQARNKPLDLGTKRLKKEKRASVKKSKFLKNGDPDFEDTRVNPYKAKQKKKSFLEKLFSSF